MFYLCLSVSFSHSLQVSFVCLNLLFMFASTLDSFLYMISTFVSFFLSFFHSLRVSSVFVDLIFLFAFTLDRVLYVRSTFVSFFLSLILYESLLAL